MIEEYPLYKLTQPRRRALVRLVPVSGQRPKAYKLSNLEFLLCRSLDKCTLEESTFVATCTRLPCHILETLLRLRHRDRRCSLDKCAERMNLEYWGEYWAMASASKAALKTWEKNQSETVKAIYQQVLKERKNLIAKLKRYH